MQILQDMISVRRIIINIMLVIPLHAVSQIDFTRPIVDTITYELQLRKVEFDQYFLKGLDSVYFNRIIEFNKPLAWCATKYEHEKYPYIAINAKVEEQGRVNIIYFHNNYTVNLSSNARPIYYFEHKGYYCILMDDVLKDYLRPTSESKLFIFEDYTVPVTDDTSATIVEYNVAHQSFRMINFAYEEATCYDDNRNPIISNHHASFPEGKIGVLRYLKSQIIDFGNYILGLFVTLVINEDGSVSPYRLWIPTCSTANQWEEISHALVSMPKWQPYLDANGVPRRTKETFNFSPSELGAER
jgi:hypothetical protein